MKLDRLQKQPYVLIIMGLLGFIAGHFIIFGKDAVDMDLKPRAAFSEIRFNPKCPSKDSLCGRIIKITGNDSLNLVVTYYAHDSVFQTRVFTKDTVDAKKQRILLRDTVSGYKDTVREKMLTGAELESYRQRYFSDVDFFRDNPVFTIWAAFIIAMLVMWFASFLPIWQLIKEMSGNERLSKVELKPKITWYFFFSLIVLVLFHGIMLMSFFDATPFFTTLFMPGWNNNFRVMNIIGFIACGPIFTGMMMVYRAAAEVEGSGKETIDYLERKLRIFLLAISIGFSFVMITTSLLYVATSQLHFMKKAAADLGRPLVNTEFVLAYGLMYSLLIAIFYLPSALRIYHLRLMQADKEGGEVPGELGAGAPIKSVITELLKSSAPLVTGIITSILGMLFQG